MILPSKLSLTLKQIFYESSSYQKLLLTSSRFQMTFSTVVLYRVGLIRNYNSNEVLGVWIQNSAKSMQFLVMI